MIIEIKVIPNAKKSEVVEKDGQMIVRVKEPAEKGKANFAVVKLLKKHFGKRAHIIAGGMSKKKVVSVE